MGNFKDELMQIMESETVKQTAYRKELKNNAKKREQQKKRF